MQTGIHKDVQSISLQWDNQIPILFCEIRLVKNTMILNNPGRNKQFCQAVKSLPIGRLPVFRMRSSNVMPGSALLKYQP